MLNNDAIINAGACKKLSMASGDDSQINARIALHGYCLLRGFHPSLEDFSGLVKDLCSSVTYDPARKTTTDSVQKVDAGTDAIGLHIENGNTPRVPQLLGFFCETAALKGSETTLCDGSALLQSLPADLYNTVVTKFTVTRTLPEALWKAYLAQEHPGLTHASEVQSHHLDEMLLAIPGQSAHLQDDGSLEYNVDTHAVRTSCFSGLDAFANALLGPSFSYEPPRYTLHNGQALCPETLQHLREIAEQHIVEIPWQDGDIALIDNWRVMHGRREILDAANRKLFIGMGDI